MQHSDYAEYARAIATLTQMQRVIVAEVLTNRHDYATIGKKYGLSEDAIRKRFRRAQDRLLAKGFDLDLYEKRYKLRHPKWIRGGTTTDFCANPDTGEINSEEFSDSRTYGGHRFQQVWKRGGRRSSGRREAMCVPRKCEYPGCGENRLGDERYCRKHRWTMLKKMRESGYLSTPLPRIEGGF